MTPYLTSVNLSVPDTGLSGPEGLSSTTAVLWFESWLGYTRDPPGMDLLKDACAWGLVGALNTSEDKPAKTNATKLLCKFLNLKNKTKINKPRGEPAVVTERS